MERVPVTQVALKCEILAESLMHVLRRPVEVAAGSGPAAALNINNHLAARGDPKQAWPLIRPRKTVSN